MHLSGNAGSRSERPTVRDYFIRKIWQIMRLTTILMLAACLQVAARSSSQTVSFTGRNVPLEKLFAAIREQTGYVFFYDRNDLAGTHNITLHAKKQPMSALLEETLKAQGLTFYIQRKTIFIMQQTALHKILDAVIAANSSVNVISSEAIADILIRGRITDSTGAPLVGATVKVRGTNNGTLSDGKGNFNLSVPDGNAVLEVSFVGYATESIQVGNEKFFTVILHANNSYLDETIVQGYGTTTRRFSTGSISHVSSDEIQKQPVTDPLAALQGRVPGLMVTASNGLPGASFSVRVRGINSLTATANEPLYIVDGVPYLSDALNQFTGANGNQSPLASINPADIDRIDVLKDADATAIYGSRAANGVILITTKKGKAGKTEVNFNVFSGISKVTHLPKMLNTQQYLALRRNAFANDKVTPDENNAPDLTLWDSTQNTDWAKKFIGNTAHFTEAQASVSGGNQQTQFLLGGSYHHESTVMEAPYGYDRGSVHLNINHTSQNGKFNVNASVSYTADKNNILSYDISQYYDLSPNYPIFDSTGAYYWFSNTQNPVAYLGRKYISRTNNLIGNSVVRYTLFPGLDLKTNLGYTKTNMDQTLTIPSSTLNPTSGAPSQADYGFSEVHSYIIEPQATYTKKVGIGTLGVLAGGTWQQRISEGHYLYGTGYAGDGQLENMQAASSIIVRNYDYSQYRYTSIFGRLNYNVDGKYIVNGSFRRDGSTRFGPNKRFGNFGAVGAAWLFYEEPFIKKAFPFLSYGKLRGSYGITGNDQIGDYSFLDSWNTVPYPYDGITGLTPARLANPDYKWETNKKLEAAIELGFWGDRILFTGSYYRNRSGNQLIGLTLSPQTGFNGITTNLPALVQNRGWEFELNTINFKGKDFNWSTNFNISINKNTLLKYPGLEGSSVQYQYVVGQPLDVVLGYQFTGVDPQTGLPGFEDANHDSALSQLDDYVVLGKASPTYFGGLGNTVSYKNWSLSFLFQFVKQDGPGLNYGYVSSPYGSLSNKGNEALDRWKVAGDVTNVPLATQAGGGEAYNLYSTYYRLSSAVWGDASYIRLKNVSLSYDLSSLVHKWKWQGCSVYFQAQNLFTITGYKGFDPETQGAVMPPLKTFTAGFRFSL